MKSTSLLLCIALVSFAASDKKSVAQARDRELEAMRNLVATTRDSLQSEIAARWRAKQQSVGQRESDKEEMDRLRESLERAHTDLARTKEEIFVRQRQLEEERSDLLRRTEGWNHLVAVLAGFHERESELIMEHFPLDREERRLELERSRRVMSKSHDPLSGLNASVNYLASTLRAGLHTSVQKRPFLSESGDSRDMYVARFGTLFAFAAENDSSFHLIRQTGLLGPGRYTTEKIEQPELRRFLSTTFPEWISQGRVAGPVLVDVLQNSQSSMLLSGQRQGAMARAVHWFKSGGPVMVFLLLLPLWALTLAVLKMVQFAIRGRRNGSVLREVLDHVDNGRIQEASQLATRRSGSIARVVSVCVDDSVTSRNAAEKRVKEALADEIPKLERHLSTLAIIAGIAPLLGLLGTVTGMISLFGVITHHGTGDPKLLAGGISEALITTETGLIIAIPILLLHNALRNKSDRIVSEMEKHALCFLNRRWPEG